MITKVISENKARIISAFMAATVAICTLPFFIAPHNVEAAVLSSNALVSADDTGNAGYSSAEDFRQAIIDACRQLDGVKYTWGGGGWNGIDCAGSVSVAYSVALGTMTINSTPGSYGSKTLSYSGGGTPDKYGFERPGFAGIKSSFTNGLLKTRGITPSENHFSDFDTNGNGSIQNDEWINIINTYGFKPGDMILWWNDNNDSTNAQHITIYAGIEDGVAMHWTGSSSMGYFCKKPLADSSAEYGKGSFTGFMGLRATGLEESAYVGFYLDKRDPSGINYTGAVFSVYNDSSLTNKVGELRDDDNDGVYTDFYALSGGSYKNQRYRLTKADDTTYEATLYFLESGAPLGAILPDGSAISFYDKDGYVPDVYNFYDSTIYSADIKITGADGKTGRLEYTITDRSGNTLFETSESGYSYTAGSDCIVITNMVTDGSTLGRGKGAGLFTDASSLSLEKITSTGVNVNSTVFTVTEGNKTVATYKYSDGTWNWYDINGNKWEGSSSFPLKYNTSYVITETFEKAAPFKCVDGSTIEYQMTNDTEGWTKVDDTTYKYEFRTGTADTKCTYDMTVENNKMVGRIRVVKSVSDEDDVVEGFVFELWNDTRTQKLATGTSGSDGIVYWQTGSGKLLSFFDVPSGNYILVENKPVRYYPDTKNQYTYKVPEGFAEDKDGNWYKEITIGSEQLDESVVNDRSEGSIKIIKSSEDDLVKGVKFNLYYGGNSAEPSWQTDHFAKGSTNDGGVLVFKNLPTGWYKVEEIVKPEYTVVWDDGTKGKTRIVHITEADDNKVLKVSAYNDVDITPEIRTELSGANASHDILCGRNVELIDKVYFDNLLKGYEYKLTGSLIDKNTGDVIKAEDGRDYIVSVVFMADEKNGVITKDNKGRDVVSGFVEVPFEIDSAYLFEKAYADGEETLSIVCFEKLEFRGIKIAEHKDINDLDQTVSISPRIGTSATDSLTGTSVLSLSDKVDINDKVSFEGLVPGEKYTVTGVLMNKSTGEVYTDPSGNKYIQEGTFTPKTSSGYFVVNFTDVEVPMEICELVVFESIKAYGRKEPIAVHTDINDEGQTVRRPSCNTYAETNGGNKAFLNNTVVTVVDHVYYENLEAGKNYYAKAALCLSNGSPVISKGIEVVSIQEFTPDASSGVVDVTMKFNSGSLNSGDRVVVMEVIYDKATMEEVSLGIQNEDVKVLAHEDLDNIDQSLSVTSLPVSGEVLSKETVIGFAIALIAAGSAMAVIVIEVRRKRVKRN